VLLWSRNLPRFYHGAEARGNIIQREIRKVYMYLHLGNEVTIRTRDIIGIFDLDTTTVSKETREFLRQCEENDMVTNVSSDLPKSFILCRYNQDIQVFISAISSATLKKRAV
jgi:hypothetical protein